jgi:hypothetical protein
MLRRLSGRKRAVGGEWYMDETNIKVLGKRVYLYRVIDGVGDTMGSDSTIMVISSSGTLPANRVRIRQSQCLNDRI